MLGRTTRGGVASVMQSTAARNEKAGLVGPADLNGVAGEGGETITEIDLLGRCLITKSIGRQIVGQYRQRAPLIGRQIVGQYRQRAPLHAMAPMAIYQHDKGKCAGPITIDEALEAAVLTVRQKPVKWSDTTAIQVAEVRATGFTSIVPGGVAVSAQSAAEFNSKTPKHDDKTQLADVLMDAA